MPLESEQARRARATWSSANYREVGLTHIPVAAHIVRAADVTPAERVLDVACGTGVTAIAARQAGARVAGLDITPELLEHARRDAALAGFEDVEWREGDAEALPWPDETFDVVVSTFGHMYAPHPDVVTREMLRVLKPGGRVAFATWPPEGYIGAFGAVLARYQPPPPKDAPPAPGLWGVEDVVRERLGDAVRDLRFERGDLTKPLLSVAHYWEFASTNGPVVNAALRSIGDDPARRAALREDFVRALTPFFHGMELHQDYLVSVATKR